MVSQYNDFVRNKLAPQTFSRRNAMLYSDHPRTLQEYRKLTSDEFLSVPVTAHSYRCAVCKQPWHAGTAGRKKAVGGGWKCPNCVK